MSKLFKSEFFRYGPVSLEELKQENESYKERIAELEREISNSKGSDDKLFAALNKVQNLTEAELIEAYKVVEAQELLVEYSRRHKIKGGHFPLTAEDIEIAEAIEQEIIDRFYHQSEREEKVIDELEAKFSQNKGILYQKLFSVLAHLNFPSEQAENYSKEILDHQHHISDKIGRDIGFRVAMLDYFININKKIRNPKIIELWIFEETLKYALIDPLTGLYNRRYYEEAFQRELNRAKRHDLCVSVLILDLDDFKKVNDTFGHDKGDVVLVKVAEFLTSLVRSEDIVCRFGGEEFLIIMPETTRAGAELFSKRLLDKFLEIDFGISSDFQLGISGGLTTFPEDGLTISDLFEKADKALYKAKFNGKHQIITTS